MFKFEVLLVSVPFPLTDKENSELGEVNRQISLLLIKRMELIKKWGVEKGQIAQKLDDLKSKDGKPFKMDSHNITKAATETGEEAYLCESLSNREGCGWVIGRPEEESSGADGPISMSGKTEYCIVCGQILNK